MGAVGDGRSRSHMTICKVEGRGIRGPDLFWVAARKTVAGIRHENQPVFDAGTGKLLIHFDRLLVRDVRVTSSVDQDCRRIVLRHIPRWTVGCQRRVLRARVGARDEIRPKPLLAAVKIERAALRLCRSVTGGPLTLFQASSFETSGCFR